MKAEERRGTRAVSHAKVLAAGCVRYWFQAGPGGGGGPRGWGAAAQGPFTLKATLRVPKTRVETLPFLRPFLLLLAPGPFMRRAALGNLRLPASLRRPGRAAPGGGDPDPTPSGRTPAPRRTNAPAAPPPAQRGGGGGLARPGGPGPGGAVTFPRPPPGRPPPALRQGAAAALLGRPEI